MQEKPVPYYLQKAEEVLSYINNHLADNLNIKLLSDKFGISFFYFHRILKAYLNEPLGSYIDRLRLETAVKLIRYSGEALSDIAVSIGYNDISSFSKAFSKEFGLSPQEFKNNKNFILNTNIDYRIDKTGKLVSDIKPKIITLQDKHVICIRVIGKYGGEATYQAWDNLFGFAKQNKLLGWKPEIYSVYYDEPEEVGIDNCSSDICIVTKKQVNDSGRIENRTIKGGKYCVFRYKGPYERLWELYDYIYSNWFLTANVKLRNLPFIEKYLNYSPKTNPNVLVTEIYIPIE